MPYTGSYSAPQLVFAGLTIPPAKSINAAAGQQRTVAVAADRALVPLTYGEDRATALILNVLISGTDPGLMLVQCLWGHALDAISAIKLNGEALPSGATVTHYTGSQSTADAALVAAFAAQSITYTDTLAGYAYSVVALPVVAFSGQLTITATLRGRKVYDPRKDSTAGGSGSHRLATPATWEWSDCPALCLADWIANATYGAGESVDWASVPAAANANDTIVGSAPGEKRRLLGLTINSAAQVADMAEALRAYAGCWLVPTGDGVRLLPDADASPAATYSHASGNIAALSPLQLPDRAAAPTVVEVVYSDISTGERRDASAEAALPGVGTTLPYRRSTVRLPGIQRYSQANREAIERLNKLSLEGVATTLETFDEGIQHQPGDIIAVTHPVGLSATTMRVVAVDLAGPGRWLLDLMRHDPASYSSSVVVAGTIADPSRRINPGPASDVTGAAATVSSGLIRVTWAPCPDTGYDSTEVRTTNANWGSYAVAPLFRAKASEFPYLVTATGSYTFYLRHISNGNPSANTVTVTLTVTAGDLPTPGASTLRLSPASSIVQADAVGNVTDWSPARSVATVTAADGSDETSSWTYTIDSTTSVVASLGGTLGNQLSITGFAPEEVDVTHSNVIIQLALTENSLDSSRYRRQPTASKANSISFQASGNPFGGGHLRTTGSWGSFSNALLRFGSTEVATEAIQNLSYTGSGDWAVSGYVRVNTAAPSGTFWYVINTRQKLVYFSTTSTKVSWFALWSHSSTSVVDLFNGTATDTTLSTSAITDIGQWVYFQFGLVGNSLRLCINGSVVASTTLSGTRKDAIYPGNPSVETKAPSSVLVGYSSAGVSGTPPQIDMCYLRYKIGESIGTGAVMSAPFKLAAFPVSGTVAIKATKGLNSIIETHRVGSLLGSEKTITVVASSPSAVLTSNVDGSMPAQSDVPIDFTVYEGAVGSSGWSLAAVTDGTYSLRGRVSGLRLRVDNLGTYQSLIFSVWLSKIGNPTQLFRLPVTKAISAQPAIIAGGPASLTVNANWSDSANANLPLSATVSAMDGSTDEAENYSWTRTSSAGLTTTISGATVTLTGMASGTLTGTITMTGTRSGWPNLTWVIAVTKVLAAQPIVLPSGTTSLGVAATWDDASNTNLPLAGSVAAIEQGSNANVTSSYAWAATGSAGLTVTNSGASFSLTNMASGTLTGTVTMTGTRALWPTLTWATSVTKALAAQPTVAISGTATLQVRANWDDSVLLNLPIGGSVTATDQSAGSSATSSYTWAATASSGLTVTNSGASFSLTAMSTGTLSGTITMTGTRSGWPTLTWTTAVTKVLEVQPTTVVAGTATLQVQANWNDTVLLNLPLGGSVTATDQSTGANATSAYTWVATASSGLTVTNSGASFSLTGMGTGTLTGTITMTGTRSGWPTLVWATAVTKRLEAQPIVVVGGPPSVVVAGFADGTVPAESFPVTATLTALDAGTNVASSYSWSVSASSGITASISSGSTTQITAMSSGTDVGTLTITGARTGWPSLTWVVTVTKSRSLPTPGVVSVMGSAIVYESGSTSLDASVKFTTDGLIQTYQESVGTWVTYGNWYYPQTSGIGNTHDVRLLLTGSSGSGLTGTSMTWVSLATDFVFTVAGWGSGTNAYFFGAAQFRRNSPAVTAPLGQCGVTLISEQT